MKKIITAMTLLAGAVSAYSGAISLNDYNRSGASAVVQVFPPQSSANSTVTVTVNGFTGHEEMGQPANSYLPLSLQGTTVYATGRSTIGVGYDVGLLATAGTTATNYSQLSPVAGVLITNWFNNASTNAVDNNYGIWSTAANANVGTASTSNASIAIAVWQNDGPGGAATTLAEAQANGYQWGVSAIVTTALGVPPGFPTELPTTLTSFSLVQSQASTNASLHAMGYNSNGQLGDGGTSPTNRPETILPIGVSAIAAYNAHSLFVKTDGTLWGMGDDANGDLGDGQAVQTNRPKMITNNVTAAAAGYLHSLFIKTDGSLWGMGYDGHGELGDGSNNSTGVFRPELITNGVMAVAAGNYFTLYLTTNGNLWGMGQNNYGQLGNGTYGDTNLPQLITNGVAAIACGADHSLFLRTNGSLWAMGDDNFGQLGDGSNNPSGVNVPELIMSSNVTAIAAGLDHSLFIESDGSLWGMGENGQGQLGLGTNATFSTPTKIVTNNVISVAGAYNHTLFVKNDGSLWAMGDDSYGDLGDGLTTQTNQPEMIVPSGVLAVAGGTYYSLFLELPPGPQIEVLNGATVVTNGQTNAVDFGNAVVGQTGSNIVFTVNNTGGHALDITNLSIPAGYTVTTNPPATIAAGGSGAFSVQLTTSATGSFAGNVTITNNDPNNNPFVFPVTGLVNGSVLSLSGHLAFGVVAIGGSSNLTLTISNGGNASFTVSNIVLPPGFSGSFSGAVAAGSAQAVPITFAPSNTISYSGTVTVDSDATVGSDTIPISGFGGETNLFLVVITNGSGAVAPVLTSKPLVAGKKYTLMATAKTTNVFAGWTGSTNTTKNPLTFVMAEGTVLEANFIPNPFIPAKGIYNGLFTASNGVITEQTAGMLKNLTVNSRGGYSGTLFINGAGHGIAGTFDAAGQSTNKIARGAAQGGNLTVELSLLTASNGVPFVLGTVFGTNNGQPWISTNLIADLASNNLPSAELTMTIAPDTNNAATNSIPGGDGYAVITNHTGSVKINGSLADGTAFSQTVPESQTGDVPVFANLYGGKGLLLGWINLDPSNAPGSLAWVHPAERTGLFTGAFTSTNVISLSAWTYPPSASSLPTNLAVVEITAGVATQTNDYTVVVSNNYKLGKVSGPTPLTGSINPKTGLLTISVGTGTGKQTGTAVILPDTTNGGGYFLTKTNSGAIQLTP